MSNANEARTQRITQWVIGGNYAIAVEVDAVYPPDDPSEPCLTRETVRWLEELAKRAEAGDLDTLRKAGVVYSRVAETQAAGAN